MKEHVDLNLDNWVQESCSISAFTSDLEEPKTFSEAWNHQEPKIRNQWREAMKKELTNMECKNVWTEKQKNENPIDRRLVGCKWVVKLKRDGAHLDQNDGGKSGLNAYGCGDSLLIWRFG